MSGLDINTPAGRETLADEMRAARAFEDQFGVRYIHTKTDSTAVVDAVIINKQNEVGGVVLASSRYNCTVDTFMTTWGAEWLLTWRKLMGGARVARDMRVTLYGFIFVVDDHVLLIKKLYDPTKPTREGRWITSYRTDDTLTQGTVNGGTAFRRNAFIDIERATRVPVPTDAERAGHTNGFVGYDSEGHFVHYCRCGNDAGHGFGASPLKEQLGTWFCNRHKGEGDGIRQA